MKSNLVEKLLLDIRCVRLPTPILEHRFHPKRRWRFDLAWIDKKLAVEVDGGTWTNGRHVRGKGYQNDCIKYGAAMELGWNIYRCTGDMVKKGIAINTIEVLYGL